MANTSVAETVKYLYLLFDVDNFIHNPGSIGFLGVDVLLIKSVTHSPTFFMFALEK